MLKCIIREAELKFKYFVNTDVFSRNDLVDIYAYGCCSTFIVSIKGTTYQLWFGMFRIFRERIENLSF